MLQNPAIEQLQELTKSYLIHVLSDSANAKAVKRQLDELRHAIAVDSEMRDIFYDEVRVPASVQGGRQNIFYSRNDVDYTLRRGIAYLPTGEVISLEKRSGDSKVFTRESTAWQQIFSAIQGQNTGLELLQDFPQELRFTENESLNIGITRGANSEEALLFLHGASLKERPDSTLRDIDNEIVQSVPQSQIIPLVFRFADANAGTEATDPNGNKEIFSLKSDRSVMLTHVSTTASDCKISLYDEGKNLQICDTVECAGVASNYLNRYTTYYELPYPHLLRRGARLKLRAVNGSDITGAQEQGSTNYFLTFKGFTV